jgi:magnesium chelatase family protein
VLAAAPLPEVAAWINAAIAHERASALPARPDAGDPADLSDVRGQEYVKLALEVAAAGGHNVLLVGAPGSGKSMLARRLPTILPPLDEREALETSAIYSAAGRLDGEALVRRRPFRAPHHDISVPGLIGGGPVPPPGEISLAHNGVLFLDELPEFQRPALEALRQPLEERQVTIVRARASVRFPASFALVGAMNPCPCGYHGSEVRACTCDAQRVRRYRARISGPLLDRFDLQVYVPQVGFQELTADRAGEPSERVRTRVLAAREVQRDRLLGTALHSNAQLGPRDISRWCRLDPVSMHHLGEVVKRRGMTARGVHRLLKVARTIADLNGRDAINKIDLQSAIDFRVLDQEVL